MGGGTGETTSQGASATALQDKTRHFAVPDQSVVGGAICNAQVKWIVPVCG